MKFELILTATFLKRYDKVIRKNKELSKRVRKVIDLLRTDPFYSSLKAHKVNARNFGVKWSSRVTGDIRIIWEFDKSDNLVIYALSIGSHIGTNRVYD
jgi:mRNA-degrading endonuclease YafQ of YafQ-DinJ toxin-antitoxin module